jgi:hypothetical protein
VKLVHWFLPHAVDPIDEKSILECQTLEDASGELWLAPGHWVVPFATVIAYCHGHVHWVEKSEIIRINDRSERNGILRQPDKLVVIEGISVPAPGVPTALEKPETHVVAKKADGASEATLIGEIVSKRSIADDGLLSLDTEK